MKILLASDLHLEFYSNRDAWQMIIDSIAEADVLVLAGDIATPGYISSALSMFVDEGKWRDVVYVAGNHEYYGDSIRRIDSLLGHMDYPGLHILDNTTKVIGGIKFVGTTLWFAKLQDRHYRKNGLNDFKHIEDAEPRIYEKNHEAVLFLEKEMEPGCVVVSHHLPSYKSVAPAYEGSE